MTQVEFTTKSGAKYVFDEDTSRVLRVGPHSAGINYELVPDNEWSEVVTPPDIEVGEHAVFHLAGGVLRVTTPVVTINTRGSDHG